MRRFLLSLVALVITAVCFAQDIIVQKDGSTIQAKIVKVSQSEVEYKKYNNQNGPTYTISTKDLQCINYENGTKDTFVSSDKIPSVQPYSSRLNHLFDPVRMQKKGKTLKNIGLIGGGAFVAGGLILLLANDGFSSDPVPSYGGIAMAGIGLVGGTLLYLNGKSMQEDAQLLSTTIYQQEFKIGKNDRLMVGVDMLKDNMHNYRTLGLGVSYNF